MSLSRIWLFVTTWTEAHQAPLSMDSSRQRILEWVAISFSRGSSWPRDWTQVSHISGRFFTDWVTRAASIEGKVKLKVKYLGGKPSLSSHFMLERDADAVLELKRLQKVHRTAHEPEVWWDFLFDAPRVPFQVHVRPVPSSFSISPWTQSFALPMYHQSRLCLLSTWLL